VNTTLYVNATFHEHPDATAALARDGRWLAFGPREELAATQEAEGARSVDLDGGYALPGFIDAHTHLLMMGEALSKADLVAAAGLEEIIEALAAARAAAPEAPRLLGRSWLFSQVPGGAPHRSMLDAAFPELPVYLDANDVHSAWLNTAALKEIGITANTPDPVGGRIGRDADGEPDGMLYETALHTYLWPAVAGFSTDELRVENLRRALQAYAATGVTGAVDMAVGEDEWRAMSQLLERDGRLPVRIVGHWLINRHEDPQVELDQVARAAELAAAGAAGPAGDWLRLAGIKIVSDGVVDACTAAVHAPYTDGSRPEAIWDLPGLRPVVRAADAAGLQIAIHAIGDAAVTGSLDALEELPEGHVRARRHRMEHLEVISEADVARIARLGIVASMQPVHADPAIQDNWRAMLGAPRIHRGYPWAEFQAAGVTLAFGTDAPTAPYEMLPNLYVAATRRSALDPSREALEPHLKVTLHDAVAHVTRDAAFASGLEGERGSLAPGQLADFVVLGRDPFASAHEELLDGTVLRTVVGAEDTFVA
jgi:predicted amidohydrolase YtcJ